MKSDNAQSGRKPLRPRDCPTPEQVAYDLGVSPETVRRWIRQGHLAAYRIGPRNMRVDLDSLSLMVTPR